MDCRERAALALFACRVTTVIIAFVFALRAVDGTVFAALLTQIALNFALMLRPPVNFDTLNKPWASPLVAYLKLCDSDTRSNFAEVFRGWERNSGAFLLMMTFIFYWNIESYTRVVGATALAHGAVMGLLLIRVRYALRDSQR